MRWDGFDMCGSGTRVAGKWETQVGIFGLVDPAAACCAADGGGVRSTVSRPRDCAYACMLVVHARRYACK